MAWRDERIDGAHPTTVRSQPPRAGRDTAASTRNAAMAIGKQDATMSIRTQERARRPQEPTRSSIWLIAWVAPSTTPMSSTCCSASTEA